MACVGCCRVKPANHGGGNAYSVNSWISCF
nr:MAG TPA: hypothetical protein [Caudoviricetes sp.]